MQLTEHQQEALKVLNSFMCNRTEQFFILEGYAGTGKTTLLKAFVANLPKINALLRTLGAEDIICDMTHITATTNKAVDVLNSIFPTKVCSTIHRALSLRVVNGRLIGDKPSFIKNTLFIIDECSMINKELLTYIKFLDKSNKIIFVGDSTQLPPIKESTSIVFKQSYPSFKLTELIRQESTELADLCKDLRISVENQQLINSININGKNICHLNRNAFNKAMEQDMCSPNWTYSKSKYICYTNNNAVHVNNKMKKLKEGTSKIQKGDYLINNKYTKVSRHFTLKTDSIVYIQDAKETNTPNGVPATKVLINNHWLYVPKKYNDLDKDNSVIMVDLRSMYACTVHKSQGNTFDRVYVNINNIKLARRDFNMFLRLLYVAVSRAKHEVIFTGDF